MLKRRPPEGNVRRATSIGLNLRGVMTNKAGRIVQYESFQEFLLTLLLERDPSVSDYGSQPETFSFFDEETGKKHSYTPDLIVWKKDGKVEIHEVTRSERQNNLNIRQREIAAQKICQSRSWKYVVHNEQQLPYGAEKVNLLFLFSYRPSIYYNQQVALALANILQGKEPMLIQSLATRIMKEVDLPLSNVVSVIFHLIWHGHLVIDFHKLLLTDGVLCPEATVSQRD